MPKTKNTLWDAERIARFSNASAVAEVKQFREAQQGFFPRNFWNWSIRQLREGVPTLTMDASDAQAIERLRREPPIPFWQAFQRVLRDAWQLGFPLVECVRLISCTAVADRLQGETDAEPDLSSFPVWPYQRAVMFLGVEPWRARFCGQCGKRFVADKPARRFCSNSCSTKARKASRMDWWNRAGEEWRAKKDAKGKRSRRTKR